MRICDYGLALSIDTCSPKLKVSSFISELKDGFDYKYVLLYINGIPMQSLQLSVKGGMVLVTRYREDYRWKTIAFIKQASLGKLLKEIGDDCLC